MSGKRASLLLEERCETLADHRRELSVKHEATAARQALTTFRTIEYGVLEAGSA
jgi:hypothetical protein